MSCVPPDDGVPHADQCPSYSLCIRMSWDVYRTVPYHTPPVSKSGRTRVITLPPAVCSDESGHTPYHSISYRTLPYRTIPYHTVPYHTVFYPTIPYHTVPDRCRRSARRKRPHSAAGTGAGRPRVPRPAPSAVCVGSGPALGRRRSPPTPGTRVERDKGAPGGRRNRR